MKQFKILASPRNHDKRIPRSVPWEMVEPWRAQAIRNHSQTLERLNERGGLSVEELYAIAHEYPGYRADELSFYVCLRWLLATLEKRAAAHEAADE